MIFNILSANILSQRTIEFSNIDDTNITTSDAGDHNAGLGLCQ